jgi:hypothetical protein
LHEVPGEQAKVCTLPSACTAGHACRHVQTSGFSCGERQALDEVEDSCSCLNSCDQLLKRYKAPPFGTTAWRTRDFSSWSAVSPCTHTCTSQLEDDFVCHAPPTCARRNGQRAACSKWRCWAVSATSTPGVPALPQHVLRRAIRALLVRRYTDQSQMALWDHSLPYVAYGDGLRVFNEHHQACIGRDVRLFHTFASMLQRA